MMDKKQVDARIAELQNELQQVVENSNRETVRLRDALQQVTLNSAREIGRLEGRIAELEYSKQEIATALAEPDAPK